MIIEAGTELANKTQIINEFTGGVVQRIISFDTKTKDAVIYVSVVDNKGNNWAGCHRVNDEIHFFPKKKGEKGMVRELTTVKVHLLGCKAIHKETGEEIK